MLLALGFASQHLDFFAHFRVRVERLTTSDDNFTIIGCREGPRQPRSVERFQPPDPAGIEAVEVGSGRSEEHTSELQSLMRISYAVFCLKKKTNKNNISTQKPCYKNKTITRHHKH